MIIDLDQIRGDVERFIGEDPALSLNLAGGEDLEVRSGMRYDLRIQVLEAELVVRGSVESDLSFRCSSCAEFFDLTVREGTLEIIRNCDQDIRSVDLTEDLREAILLAFPAFPRCVSTCRGLCSQCGANLNDGGCGCRRKSDDRWTGLDDLQVE